MSKQKINTVQKNKLLDLLASKPHLRSGKFSSTFTHREAQKEWEEISQILNSIPGANKDWKAWRKTWQDILSKTKAKSASINKIRRGTGGGPPPSENLDDFEEEVAALLHPHSISGHTESVESAVSFDDVAYVIPPLMEVSELQSSSQTNDGVIIPPPVEYATINVDAAAASAMPPSVEMLEPPSQTRNKSKKINMKSLLKEKLNIKCELLNEKKKFYAAFLINMERQSRALEDISRLYINNSNSNN